MNTRESSSCQPVRLLDIQFVLPKDWPWSWVVKALAYGGTSSVQKDRDDECKPIRFSPHVYLLDHLDTSLVRSVDRWHPATQGGCHAGYHPPECVHASNVSGIQKKDLGVVSPRNDPF